uniref:Pathogenesis-related protein 10 n=1 Tax=Anacardium occidentale TaxID=171929 RepID=A0A7D9N402_ANAOC|nr:pathogenesis-related protein 10 [Anacardium occidentale]
MGVITFTEEFSSPVPARRLFKAFVLDFDNLLPKLMPQVFKNIETIEGDGGPGTIKKLNISEGGEVKYLKHRIDALDKEKLIYNYTIIEGDAMDKIESVSYEIKYEVSPDGGCKGTTVNKYYPKTGIELEEEKIKEARAKAMGLYKVVEGYLLANPDAYA